MSFVFDSILENLPSFKEKLKTHKENDSFLSWYPYGILDNFYHLDNLLKENRNVFDRLEGRKILDLGCADGDLGYFMESQGYEVDLMDHAQPNHNDLQGANRIKELLESNVNIYDRDIDSQFIMPDHKYDLVFFLGILYHLKNPFYILEQLSHQSRFMFISTRIAKYAPDGTDIQNASVGYLLGHGESENGDLSNFFIFSEKGLKNLLVRSGWQIMNYMSVGSENSDPHSVSNDERAFCLCESWRPRN